MPKILVVDDEPDLEALIVQKFRGKIKAKEYEFLFARDGSEALTVINNNDSINLVLTDINMPVMDGLTLLSKINELNNKLLRSVIVSAYGDMENIRTAMNRGAYDFITKPINLNDLEITIEKSLKESVNIEAMEILLFIDNRRLDFGVKTSVLNQNKKTLPTYDKYLLKIPLPFSVIPVKTGIHRFLPSQK